MGFEISGLDDLQRDLENAQRALRTLDGSIAQLEFNPDDPASVNGAIREMETAIDRKVAPYGGNPLVVQITTGLKEQYRQYILKRARGEE